SGECATPDRPPADLGPASRTGCGAGEGGGGCWAGCCDDSPAPELIRSLPVPPTRPVAKTVPAIVARPAATSTSRLGLQAISSLHPPWARSDAQPSSERIRRLVTPEPPVAHRR